MEAFQFPSALLNILEIVGVSFSSCFDTLSFFSSALSWPTPGSCFHLEISDKLTVKQLLANELVLSLGNGWKPKQSCEY